MSLRTKIIGNKNEAILWVASIVILIFFQGIISTLTQATMAARAANSFPIICTTHTDVQNEDDESISDLLKGCCSSICQTACSIGVAVAGAQLTGFFYRPVLHLDTVQFAPNVRGPPSDASNTPRLRGPPYFSV